MHAIFPHHPLPAWHACKLGQRSPHHAAHAAMATLLYKAKGHHLPACGLRKVRHARWHSDRNSLHHAAHVAMACWLCIAVGVDPLACGLRTCMMTGECAGQ
jgi:hypothetical protein